MDDALTYKEQKFMRTMKDMKKVLTVVMALAVALAGVVVLFGENSSAESENTAPKYDFAVNGPLDFNFVGSGVDNYNLKNQIQVVYDKGTYVVTGTLAKQETSGEGAFAQLWGDADYPYGIAFKATLSEGQNVIVGDGDAGTGPECLLFVKEATQNVVKIGSGEDWTEYTIDFKGVVLSEKKADHGYVVIPNANAIVGAAVKGVDCDGGSWSLSEGTLTLTNYNGEEYFDGGFSEVILVGKNSITLSGADVALRSSQGFTIKSINGVGSLDIVMDEVTKAAAIVGQDVKINGVDVSISITEKEKAEDDSDSSAIAVSASNFELYDATLVIDVEKTDYENAGGIVSSGKVDIKSAVVDVNAGSYGISAGEVSIAASDVDVKADQFGIMITEETGNTRNGNGSGSGPNGAISITNKSGVEVEVYGLAEGYYQPYGIYTVGLNVQSDSVLRTAGMFVAGGAVNNATVINDGDMVITNLEKGFDNAGMFENNGVMGIYGKFVNSNGQTSNNGEIRNYAQVTGGSFKMSIKVANEGKTLEVSSKEIQPLANGKFLVELGVKFGDEAAVNTESGESSGEEDVYYGVIDFTLKPENSDWDVTGFSIDATDDEGNILTVVYDKSSTDAKYDVYYSEGAFDYRGQGEDDNENNENNEAGPVSGVKSCDSVISVTGGSFINGGVVSVGAESSGFLVKGEFSNQGTFTVDADLGVSGGKLSGNDAVVGAGVTLDLAGEIDMVFSHSGSYTTTSTSSTSVVTQFTDVVEVVGKTNKVVIKTPGVDDRTNKGSLKIGGMGAKEKETASITLLQGSASVAGAVGTGMQVKVASGATLQVDKTSDAEATAGVISVQDGAELNMKVPSDRNTYSYGELKYTISFQNEGYTYYGSIQFALANAAEGATLKLDSNEATIDADTAVRKGITLVFADKAELAIKGTEDKEIVVSMGEGAKFILGTSSKLTVDNHVTFSGTVVYDVNEMGFDKVKFKGDATVIGVKASATNSSSLGVDVEAVDGTISISKGLSTGTLIIGYNSTNAGKLGTTSKLVISEGAEFETSTTSGSFGDSVYADTIVDGTLRLNMGASVAGKISGAGSVILKDGISVIFSGTATVGLTLTNGADRFIFDGVTGAVYNTDGTINTESSKEFTVSSVAKTATGAAYLVIYGDIVNGTITSEGNAVLGTDQKGFGIGTKSVFVVPADSTLTIAKVTQGNQEVSADGLLKVAGELNMKVEGDSKTYGFGTLKYQITYTDGEFTVYTMLSTGVSNASAGDSFEVTESFEIENNMEIPAGVTLIIAEGVKITVKDGKYISIGTPIKSVGATSSIQGKIFLSGNSFVIVYADDSVDMSKAEIVTGTPEKTAKNSQYSLLNEIYATVYGAESYSTTSDSSSFTGTKDSDVEAVLVPGIDGYRFLGWEPLVDMESDVDIIRIGQTDFEAKMKASMVKVTFTKVDGISYYVDNEKQNLVGAPVYVAYGSTVTAVADYGYTGNALVNGQAYIVVDTDTTTITGSGVSVSEPEVTVDPVKDDSVGITEYLLIVLVILAAILVVVVAIRMMRS